MRGAYTQYVKQKGCCGSVRQCPATEAAHAKRKEDAELRLARIQNGKHESYQNGKMVEVGPFEIPETSCINPETR